VSTADSVRRRSLARANVLLIIQRYARIVPLRDLTDEERALLDFLLQRDFEGRDALLVQAATVQTRGSSCGCGCPSFSLVPDVSLTRATTNAGVVSDAHGTDPGGTPTGVLLFVKDGYLDDLEIYSADGGDFHGLPRVSALKLSEWSEANEHGTRFLLNPQARYARLAIGVASARSSGSNERLTR
jgi:hypothetical protein